MAKIPLQIVRHVSKNGLDNLEPAFRELQTIESFVRKQSPFLTVLRTGRLTEELSKAALKRIVNPLPRTAVQSAYVKIHKLDVGLRIQDRHPVRLLMLTNRNFVNKERQEFQARLHAETGIQPSRTQPDIFIGWVQPGDINHPVFHQLPNVLTDAVSLRPIVVKPEYLVDRP